MYPDLDVLSFEHMYRDSLNRQDHVYADEVYCRSRGDRLIGRPVMTVTKNPCVYDLIVSGEILRWYVCRPDEHHIHTQEVINDYGLHL